MRRSLLLCLALLGVAAAQTPKPETPDLTKQPTVYVVGYAHLDTEWRWEYPTTIGTYIKNTMRDNFALFEKYPHYVFNFSGANRYRMMKEYFPADYERVKKYVASGQWFPAGSSMEENDVNSPNAESVIRQILYGKEYFRKDFGKTSAEFMLPDCFGFPASLPSILAHVGIKGFSTQKLSSGWQPAPHVGGPNSPEKDSRRNSVQRGTLGRHRWPHRHGRAQSGKLRRQRDLRHQQGASGSTRAAGLDTGTTGQHVASAAPDGRTRTSRAG